MTVNNFHFWQKCSFNCKTCFCLKGTVHFKVKIIYSHSSCSRPVLVLILIFFFSVNYPFNYFHDYCFTTVVVKRPETHIIYLTIIISVKLYFNSINSDVLIDVMMLIKLHPTQTTY